MDKDIKKKLTRNWFINLQEMICNAIQQIEGGKIKFLKRYEVTIKAKVSNINNDLKLNFLIFPIIF